MTAETIIASDPVVLRTNVPLIRRVYDALTSRDAVALQALSHPDILVCQSDELPWGGIYAGIEQALVFFTRVVSYLDSNVKITETLDAGDCIVASGHTSGPVKKTGKDFDVPVVHIWRLKSGKIVSLDVFLDNPSMLTAL